jgi:hypothetical protein
VNGTQPKILVQKILDAKCAQCHSGGAGDPFAGKTYQLTATNPGTGTAQNFTIPYLDLSSAEIEVVYDRKTASYPKSYVSLFFPAAMEMAMGTTVTGQMPPKWAIPNDARESALIKKLNVKAPDGTFAYGTSALHPEDKGITLTDDERLVLIQSIDAGGQFYARQNTGFTPNPSDPVAASASH